MTGLGGFPRRFDNYVLLKPLARGGMGQLHLALTGTPGLEKLCVIKQVIPDLPASENSRRFRDEALVALRLAHGNMVSVFDAGMQGGQIFLAMEYVDGKDLLATWNRCADRRVPFPVDISVYIVKEVTRALVYAHAFEDLELVHRDVSPANVLLSYTGEVKLTDFGLAMSILKMERTTPGIVYGKLSYLSPEQARRQPLDGRVDIYAAGIMLWELLTGRQLFPIASPADQPNPDAMARARNPEVVPPSTISHRVPPELDRIVLRALAVEREDRYPNAELLRADLAAFLAETAPKTDADRLAGFLRPLFADDVREEKRERDRLIAGSRAMLSGGHGAPSGGHRGPSAGLSTPLASLRDEPHREGEDPRIGTTLGGRYHIRRLCGEGAMGRVYEGQHIDIGRRVAIKVLHARFHHSADLVERFRREARAASKIGHPNIVDVTDSGSTPDGAFYFVMEFLDGVNLEDLILGTGPLPVERALLVAAQISRALEAAHAAEVIHRDLKPANVMLVNRNDEADFVKVLDFGISKDLDLAVGAALTRPDIAIGTPAYMAPEQAAGKSADALTDVYAVGGLLYEMLTATQPCTGGDAIEVLQRKATEDPRPIGELRPELPRDVQRLVMRALARAPSDRHPSMAALKEQVVACLTAVEGAPTPARMPSSSLITPRMPMGSNDTVVAPASLPVPVRRVRLRGAALAGGVLLTVFALVLVRFAREQAVADLAPTETIAVGVPPSAKLATPASRPAQPMPTSLVPADVVAAPPQAVVPRAPMDGEPRKVLAASGRHLLGAEATAALGHAPAAHPSPSQSDATGEMRATKAAPSAPSTPRASLADTTAILTRGQTAFDRGDYQEAIRQGRQAIAAGAEINGRLLVGDVYFYLERYREALREYNAAVARDPSDTSARKRRDLAREKAGQAAQGDAP